ncbi:MAG: GIY-YIG nuclease family protein [Pontibacterium sp.]
MDQSIQPWYVYILLCADGSLYTGVTTQVQRRLRQHNGELVGGAKYTATRRPHQLVYQAEFASRSLACQREYAIKKMTKQQKLRLLQGD